VWLALEAIHYTYSRQLRDTLSENLGIKSDTCTSRNRNDNAPLVGDTRHKMRHVTSCTTDTAVVTILHLMGEETDRVIVGK
jgi:hypothetical protein